MTQRILMVCLGNICRSPTAEAVLRQKAREAGIDVEVESAGTGDWHVGESPHPPMVEAAKAKGYDLSSLKAQQITPGDFETFDLILAADPDNVRDIEALRPEGNDTPVKLLASYADGSEDTIPDPYYTKDFDGALDLVERACDGLIAQLQ